MQYTKKQVNERTSDYICHECGQQFLTEADKNRNGVYTAHSGICGLCGQEKTITHMRQYHYLYIPKRKYVKSNTEKEC